MLASKQSKRGNVQNMKNASSDVLKNQINISENPDKNPNMEKFNDMFRSYENGKLDAKTLKGKIKTELGVKAKDNTYLDEMLKNENVDRKKFSHLLRESKILSDAGRKNYPDFSPIVQNSSLNMNYHKRFRYQKTVLFEDRPETFNNEFINKDNNKSLKEGIQKYVKGELPEAELKNVLKENNINADLNSVKRQIRSASIAGQNQNKNLMLAIMKNKNGEGPTDHSHSTFLDFTPNTEYKEPLAKMTKRLYANNQSFLSDKRNFYWFDCDDSNSNKKLSGHYRNNSTLNLATTNTPQKKQENNYAFVKPSDPSLNKMNKKLMTVSSRNNMESQSFFTDLKMRSASTAFGSC